MLHASAVGPSDLVYVPIGAPAYLERAIVTAGARLVAIDLDPVSGAPLWPEGLASPREGRTVCILEHRFGRPAPPPQPQDRWLVLEEATGAIGGTAGGHSVGSLGRAAVMKLGGWPFDRSRGALMATDAADVAAHLHATAGIVPLAPPGSALEEVAIAHWGKLGADATDLEDRVDACRAAAGVYDSAFRPLDLPMSVVAAFAETAPTYSTYLLHTRDADGLIEALGCRGIEARRPIHARLSSALADPQTAWPGAKAFYSRAVALPCHPDLGLDELLYVADAVRQHLQGLPARP